MFTQTTSTSKKTTNTGGRWANYVVRARTCFRATTVIDTTSQSLQEAARELAEGKDPAAEQACEALREAERALARARECLALALEAKKLTPANREPEYGLPGSTH